MSQTLLKELVRSGLDQWTEDKFQQLKSIELAVCCRVIGIPFTGSKPRKVKRLTTAAALLHSLRLYDRTGEGRIVAAQMHAMAEAFSGVELKALCKQAGIHAPAAKYGKAAALLYWRRNCLAHGTAFVRQAQRSRYRQLWFS